MIIESRALENLEVRGAEYPPPPGKVRMAQFLFYLQLALFAAAFFGESALQSMQISPPEPVRNMLATMKENKFASFMFVWLAGNMVQSSLLSTGAFEIHHGDKLIWSSLEEKRLPNMGDLISAFRATGVEFMTTERDGA
mmetsp:Transcript_75915/g.210739  ORF Transcript_75915/g.210739 Transcript_75915/m.210739 type:complete len:139 (-) Transcript_75915:374-790(-)